MWNRGFLDAFRELLPNINLRKTSEILLYNLKFETPFKRLIYYVTKIFDTESKSSFDYFSFSVLYYSVQIMY